MLGDTLSSISQAHLVTVSRNSLLVLTLRDAGTLDRALEIRICMRGRRTSKCHGLSIRAVAIELCQ